MVWGLHMALYKYKIRGHLQESVLSYCMDPGDQIQVVRVGGKYFYTLRHPDCLGILKF